MCRTFIHRSAFHRMNSISSASRCVAARDGGRAVVLLDAAIDDQAALDEVARHRRARIRRRMLDVGPVDVPSRERQIGLDRLPLCRRDCRRSGRRRRACRGGAGRRRRPCVALPTRRPLLALAVLRARPSGRRDRRRGCSRCRGTRSGSRPASSAARASSPCAAIGRGHPLHEVVDVVEPGVDDGAGTAPRTAATSSVMLSSTKKMARAPRARHRGCRRSRGRSGSGGSCGRASR